MIKFKVNEKKLTTARGEQTFHFAKAVYNGVTTIEQLQMQIARISAVSEGDVRSTLLTLTQLITDELTAGRIVELGDLGRMKVGLKSKATESKEKFRSQDIKRLHVIFTPGKLIKEGLLSTSLHSISKEKEMCPAQNPTPDSKQKAESSENTDDPNKDYTGL